MYSIFGSLLSAISSMEQSSFPAPVSNQPGAFQLRNDIVFGTVKFSYETDFHPVIKDMIMKQVVPEYANAKEVNSRLVVDGSYEISYNKTMMCLMKRLGMPSNIPSNAAPNIPSNAVPNIPSNAAPNIPSNAAPNIPRDPASLVNKILDCFDNMKPIDRENILRATENVAPKKDNDVKGETGNVEPNKDRNLQGETGLNKDLGTKSPELRVATCYREICEKLYAAKNI